MNVNIMPVIRGKVIGADRVSWMMGKAPEDVSIGVFSGFIRGRNQFIGTAKKKGNVSGLVRRRLERIKNWGGRISPTQNSSTWTRQFSSTVKGRVDGNSRDLKTLSLHVGVLYNTKYNIHVAAEIMGHGGTINSAGKYMIVPIYANLQRVGIMLKTGKSGEALRKYMAMGKMFVLKRGGKVLYYDSDLWRQGERGSALMFIGMKTSNVKRKFDFDGQWNSFSPRFMKLVGQGVDRAVKKLEKKQTAGKI
jgi:hypothetical protein